MYELVLVCPPLFPGTELGELLPPTRVWPVEDQTSVFQVGGQWGLHRSTLRRSLGRIWNRIDPSWGFLPRSWFSASWRVILLGPRSLSSHSLLSHCKE